MPTGLAALGSSEKKVISIAILVSVGHLLLIAYAAIFLHLSVPTCQPNEKLFTEPSLHQVGPLRYEVHYVARMWDFLPKQLVIPQGATVEFFLASVDVNHGFHINGTLVNLMAVPGVINKATKTFTRVGVYPVICHEYCGLGHQNMNALITVAGPDAQASMDLIEHGDLPQVLSDVRGAGKQSPLQLTMSPAALAGKKHYSQKGCIGCHNLTGATQGVGPSFKGIYGREEVMEDGLKLTVDDAYILESIKYPAKKIVKGYANVMPLLPVSDPEILELIEYLKTIH